MQNEGERRGRLDRLDRRIMPFIVYEYLPAQEQAAYTAWDHAHADDSHTTLQDWPGWEKYRPGVELVDALRRRSADEMLFVSPGPPHRVGFGGVGAAGGRPVRATLFVALRDLGWIAPPADFSPRVGTTYRITAAGRAALTWIETEIVRRGDA